MNDNV